MTIFKNILIHIRKGFVIKEKWGLWILLLFIVNSSVAQNQIVIDTNKYPWIHPEFDSIQFFQRKSIEPFYNAWKNTSKEKMVIVFMGDSHVQSDILPGELRKILQGIHGAGGRGMIFPYSTAKTYSSVEYKSTHTGEWFYGKGCLVPSKIPLGVSGMTARTSDSTASFTISFFSPLPADYTKLRVYCKMQQKSFDISLSSGDQTKIISVDSLVFGGKPYIEIDLPQIAQQITVKMIRSRPNKTEFEFYGMDLMSQKNNGVVIHSVGVGAAQYQSVLYEQLIPEQLPTLEPDLVILDFGTNDYLYNDKIMPDLEDKIIKSINIIRAAAPNTSILLTSTMDMYHRGRDLKSGVLFSDLVRNIARKESCMFFDWFWIAGGPTVMKKWQQSGLAQKDYVHLTFKGYKLKGQLLSNAITNTILWMDKNTSKDSLVLSIDSVKKARKEVIQKINNTPNNKTNSSATVYYIRKGDTLGSIARKYGVTVSQIKKWNGLKSDMIVAGKALRIYN